MELSEIIKQLNWRTAVKSFDADKKIVESDLNKLCEVLRLSPSSYGFQPWKFVIVKDVVIREKLREVSHGQPQVTEASDFIVLCSKLSLDQSDVDHYIHTMAQVRGVQEEDLEGFKKILSGFINNKTTAELGIWTNKQVYIALGNLLTACAVAGIDACPMEGFEVGKYNEILQLPQIGFTASVVCAIGYRKVGGDDVKRKKVRFPMEEVIIQK